MKSLRGIMIYLVVTLAISYGVYGWCIAGEIVIRSNRFTLGLYIFLGVALLPGVAAAIAQRVSGRLTVSDGRFWPGMGWALAAVVGTHAVIVGHFLLQWSLGYLEADWSLRQLYESLPTSGELNLPFEVAPPAMVFLLLITAVLTGLLLAPIALVSEYGWRGYLYRVLVVEQGRLRANLITGIAWGLWFSPLVVSGILSSAMMTSTLIRSFLMALAFGTVLSELYRRSRSLLPPALAASAWLAHVTVPWYTLFIATTFPYTWHVGWIAVGVWSFVAILLAAAPGGRRWLDDPPAVTQGDEEPSSAG